MERMQDVRATVNTTKSAAKLHDLIARKYCVKVQELGVLGLI